MIIFLIPNKIGKKLLVFTYVIAGKEKGVLIQVEVIQTHHPFPNVKIKNESKGDCFSRLAAKSDAIMAYYRKIHQIFIVMVVR